MTHNRLLAVAIVLASGILGPASVATADDAPTPSPTQAAATAEGQAPTTGVAEDAPANQPPVAVDDPDGTVVAGKRVPLEVLANDTDDGLGRPDGQVPHLEIATFDDLDGRVTVDSTNTVLTFASRPDDARRTLAIRYTATDGSLPSASATATVAVKAPPAPPVVRTVSLTASRGMIALHSY